LCIDEAEKRASFKQIPDSQEDKLKQIFDPSSTQLEIPNQSNMSDPEAFECCDISLNYWFHEQYLNLESGVLFQIFLVIVMISRFLTTTVHVNVNQRFLILVMTSMACIDMIEFFSIVRMEEVYENISLVYVVLVVVSFSVIQFLFLNLDLIDPSSFTKSPSFHNEDSNSLMKRSYNFLQNKFKPKPFHVSFVSFKQKKSCEQVMSNKSDVCCMRCGPARKFFTQKTDMSQKNRNSNQLVFIIISSLFLHDLSFLAFRLFLCIQYGWYQMIAVNNSNLLFLMTKNLVITVLQIYKLYSMEKSKKIQRQNELILHRRLEFLSNNSSNYFRKNNDINNNINSNNNINKRQLSNDPYRFAQLYTTSVTDEADSIQNMPQKSKNKPSFEMLTGMNNENQFYRKKFEYQQQKAFNQHSNEYPLGNVNHFCRNRYDEKSDTETNVSMLES
jgi:hypothetical protein